MKVLFVSHACSTPINMRFMDRIAENKKIKLLLLTVPWWMKGKKMFKKKNYDVIVGKTLFGPHIFRFFFFPPLIGTVLKFKPDIINIDEEPGSFVALQAVLWKKITGAKLVFKTCENIYRFGRFPLPIIEKLVLKQSDMAIALNTEAKEVLKKKGFEKKIKVVALGIEEKDFKKTNPDNTRKKLGLDSYTIGYIGRLVPEKSVETLIEAASRLDFEFQLLIDDWLCDEQYRKKLVILAGKTGILNRIVFVNPSHDEVYKYFNCIDLLVVPSKTTSNWKEQFGKVVVEAMFLEKQVVVSDSGNLPELAVDQKQVFIEGNASDLAEKISFFYRHKKVSQKIIVKGKKNVKKNFLWKTIARKTVSVFMEILGEKN